MKSERAMRPPELIEVSVVIPTLNAGKDFEETLRMIFNQRTSWRFEVIVIDSGSTDRTAAIAQEFPVRFYEVDKGDFNHGMTRQWGIDLARGHYVVFLVQDAVPCDHCWLTSLVEAFQSADNVAGVYSRQIAKPGCDPIARSRLDNWIAGKDEKRTSHIESRVVYDSLSPWKKRLFIHFDDVSACVAKSIMKTFPYSKTEFGEDVEWSKRVLEAGYTIIYEPKSKVYHSHRTSIVANSRRAFADHKALKALLGVDFYSQFFRSSKRFLLSRTLDQIKDDFAAIKRSKLTALQKAKWMLYAVPVEMMEKIAMVRGAAAADAGPANASRKTRIVIVTHDFPPDHYGGVSFITYDLAKALSRNNEVSVFYRKWNKDIADYEVQSEIYDGLAVTSVSNDFAAKRDFMMVYNDRHIDRVFRQFLAERQPDIVHFHHLGAGLSTGMVAVAKEYNIPIVLTLHDYWLLCPRGQMMDYHWELCSEVIEAKCARCVGGIHAPVSQLVNRQDSPAFIDLVGGLNDPVLPRATVNTADRRFVRTCGFKVNGIGKHSLLAHPPSAIRYRVRLPSRSILAFSVAMSPTTWEHKEGEGVLFEIVLSDKDDKSTKLFSQYIDPKKDIRDRQWHDCRLDLSDFGDRTVDLTFTTAAGPKKDNTFCSACWGDLKIIVQRANSDDYGVADLRSLPHRVLSRAYTPMRVFRKPSAIIRELILQAHRIRHARRSNKRQIAKRRKQVLETLDKIDLLIAPSKTLQDIFIEFGVPPHKLFRSTYGLSTGSIKKANKPPSTPVIFGYFGTLMPTKGVHVAIDAMVKLLPGRAELRIYGDAPNEYHLDYVQFLKSKIEGRSDIRHLGEYERQDLSKMLGEIDVLIVPSIWNEIGPLTIKEAFMAGVPVIASDIGGMAELVEHNVSGLLFSAGDCDALSEQMMRLMEDPGMIEALRAKIPSVRSVDANVAELEEIYSRLIANPRGTLERVGTS